MKHVSVHVGQTHIPTRVAISQLLVVQAQLVECRRPQVINGALMIALLVWLVPVFWPL